MKKTMRILIDAYVRPMTRETFFETFQCLAYEDTSFGWDESARLYLGDYFWDDFNDKMDEKSIYRVIFVLKINCRSYYSLEGPEYDENYEIEQVLLIEHADNFKELRQFVEAMYQDQGIETRRVRLSKDNCSQYFYFDP